MANNYYDCNGVLVLTKVTPVINALFRQAKLDPSTPGNGEAYIALIAEDNCIDSDTLAEHLEELATELGLKSKVDSEGSALEWLLALADHYGHAEGSELAQFIESIDFDNNLSLRDMFEVAKGFDDGHGLTAMKLEGSWSSDKPRLFEFGGNGNYWGRHFTMDSSSSTPIVTGEIIDQAIQSGDIDKAVQRVLAQFNDVLDGFVDDAVKQKVRAQVGLALTQPQVQ